jgi:hypothetical protein
MFPGYLFARFELASMHRHVRYAHGVSGIVKFADRYPTIEEGAMTQLRGHTDAAEVKELVYELSKGDQVVTQVLEAKERVKVLMDFLGRKMEAEVQWSSVIRQVSHPLAAWSLSPFLGFETEIVTGPWEATFDSYNQVQMEGASRVGSPDILGFGFTVMRAALQATVEKGFLEEYGKQPMAVACRQNRRKGHRLRGGIISDLSLNRCRKRSIFRFGRTEFFFAFHSFSSHKGRSRVARVDRIFPGTEENGQGR